jgi:hypothetical protein
MEKSKVLVVYKNYIPENIVTEFIQDARIVEMDADIETKKDEESYYNFDGEINDIVIYIKTHITEFIANGFVAPLMIGIFVAATSTLWKGIKSLNVKRIHTGDNYQDKKKNILIRVGDTKQSIELLIDESVSLNIEVKANESLRELLNSPKLRESLKNPMYFENPKDKPRVRISFNEDSQNWEIINYEAIRQIFEKLRIEANRGFEN